MKRFSALTILPALFASSLLAGELEVLHWWTSEGEKRAADVLKSSMLEQGEEWRDFSVAGQAGISAMNTLRIRAISGNPPTAAQIKGPEIQEWANLGFLRSLDDIAQQQNWDAILPTAIADRMKFYGRYIAVPINIHRVNWLWINKHAFDEAGADIPDDFDSFFTAATKLKAAGYIPLALGNEPWQVATLFDTIALSQMGPALYQRAFLDFERDALLDESVTRSFELLAQLRPYTDKGNAARSWSETTALLIEDKAGMQVMGDWAKAEFLAQQKIYGEDFLCVAVPGTENMFSFNVDSFVFFNPISDEERHSQTIMASHLLDPDFQRQFNREKGSLPIRNDISQPDKDHCALLAQHALTYAEEHDAFIPSMSHGLSATRHVQSAIFDVISEFYNASKQDPEAATQALYKAILSAQY